MPNGTNPSLQFNWQMALCLKSLSSQSQNPLLDSSGGTGHDRISSPLQEFYISDTGIIVEKRLLKCNNLIYHKKLILLASV